MHVCQMRLAPPSFRLRGVPSARRLTPYQMSSRGSYVAHDCLPALVHDNALNYDPLSGPSPESLKSLGEPH